MEFINKLNSKKKKYIKYFLLLFNVILISIYYLITFPNFFYSKIINKIGYNSTRKLWKNDFR